MVIFQTPYHLLKDDETQTRITTLVDFIDSGTDPFATEVRYYHSC